MAMPPPVVERDPGDWQNDPHIVDRDDIEIDSPERIRDGA